MKKITITAYNYNELNEQAKQNAYYKISDFLTDINNDIFYQNTLDELSQKFGNSNLGVQYDFGGCQGDGVNIYGNFDLRDFLPLYQASEKIKRTITFYIDILKKCYCWDALTVELSRNNRYTFSQKFIDKQDAEYIAKDIAQNLKDNNIKNINLAAIVDFIDGVFNMLENTENAIDKSGEQFFDFSDDYINDFCDANGILFDKAGATL